MTEQVNLARQLKDIQSAAGQVSSEHGKNSTELNRCITARNGATRELERLNGELLKCWNELESARGTRLELFGTTEKYLRGHDALVRAQCERWLLKDSFWLEGYFWAGLAAFEMGELDAAVDLVERGKRVTAETAESLGRRAQAGRLQALSGLVATRAPSQKQRGSEDLKAAVRVATKDRKEADWMVYILAGRVAMERDRNYAQANTHFSRAAELKASPMVRLWQARLQTIAPPDTPGADLTAGTKTLHQLWIESSEQSWRSGLFLVEAYLAQPDKDAATTAWKKVRVLLPESQRSEVEKSIEEKLASAGAK